MQECQVVNFGHHFATGKMSKRSLSKIYYLECQLVITSRWTIFSFEEPRCDTPNIRVCAFIYCMQLVANSSPAFIVAIPSYRKTLLTHHLPNRHIAPRKSSSLEAHRTRIKSTPHDHHCLSALLYTNQISSLLQSLRYNPHDLDSLRKTPPWFTPIYLNKKICTIYVNFW